jgi:hypothetical protein
MNEFITAAVYQIVSGALMVHSLPKQDLGRGFKRSTLPSLGEVRSSN